MKRPIETSVIRSNKKKKQRSRRLSQRRAKRYKNWEKEKESQALTLHRRQTANKCLANYGFCANHSQTLQHNFNNAIRHPPSPFFQQPSNLAFHNLCTDSLLPPGTKQLLGLDLKYCLASSQLSQNINTTALKLAYSVRTKHYLLTNSVSQDSEYIKQLYKKNKHWDPPPATSAIENKITLFEKTLKMEQNRLLKKLKKTNLSNLTPSQIDTLQLLRKNKNIVIKPTDKNLGPVVIDTEKYVHQVLKEHLLTKDYKQLTSMEATNKIADLTELLKNLIKTHHQQLNKDELMYFQRSFQQRFRLPIFYGLPKVHKNPVTLRPVVSTTNSLLAIFSVWLDYKMKDLLPLIQSYIKNSTTIIKELEQLNIPENALLFTADATSMYTNIDTETGITAIREFLLDNHMAIPTSFPTDLFLQVLTIVMENNIFSFSNTYWLQLTGTAMGTPAACNYATITFGTHENKEILPRFSRQILYYRRYIDDIFGIWIPTTVNIGQDATWNSFKERLNNWGSLQWVIDKPSTQVHFLDLNITINKGKITTSTYQKDMNLYLYIPPRSAHPSSCLKGLLHGELQRYWIQNNPTDFQEMAYKFIQRLLARGHTIDELTPLLLQAASHLNTARTVDLPKNTQNADTLFIHWQHHPQGLQRRHLHQIYNATLKQDAPYSKMTVAVSRPTNLRDLLVRAQLNTPSDTYTQDIINRLTQP